MVNKFRKTVIFAVTLAIFVSVAVCSLPVAAETASPKTLPALGDSLTTGYGPDNYVYGGEPYLCDSYINRIAAATETPTEPETTEVATEEPSQAPRTVPPS